MNAHVTWSSGMEFTGTASGSGASVALSADPAVGGTGDGFRPLELMLVSLVGCTAMDVISILQKKRQDITGFEVRVDAGRAAEHPKVFTNLAIHYILRGRGIDPAAVERAIQLSETKYCPAQAMLSQVAPTTLTYEIVESD